MNRLLHVFFIGALMIFCVQLHAQTPTPKKPKKETAPSNKSNNNSSGAGGITIDEGGQSRPTKGKQQTTAPNAGADSTKTATPNDVAPPKEAAREAEAPKIAIDEGGQTRPGKGRQQSTATDGTPSNADSATKSPAELIARPQEE